MSQKLKTYSNKKKHIGTSLQNTEIENNNLRLAKKCGEIYLENDKFFFLCLFCGTKAYEDVTRIFLEHFEKHKSLFLNTKTAELFSCIDLIDNRKTDETVMSIIPSMPTFEFNKTGTQNQSEKKFKIDIEDECAININQPIVNGTSTSKKDILANDWNELIDSSNIIDNDTDNNINIEKIRDQFPAINLRKNKSGRFQCPIGNCETTLAYLGSVYRHLKNQHTGKPYKCLKCLKLFPSKFNLERHLRVHDEKIDKERKPYYRESKLKLDSEIPNDDGLFHCKDCDGKYKSAYIRYVHSRKKHTPDGNIPYYCEICGKALSSGNNLREHMKIHTGERPFKCSYCDKSFANKFGCLMHIRIHTGDKRYRCNYCEKLFITSTERKVHERVVHTKEKPLQCEQCGKKFFTSQKLKEHFRRHTGERPYPCVICKKSFFNKSQLKDHMPSHSNEKPFECNICAAKFPRKKALTTHMQLHSDIKQYACKFCSQTFAQCAGLHSHMKQHEYSNI